MTLNWRNPDGTILWSTSGEFRVEGPPVGIEEMELPFIAALDLPLDRAGAFALGIQLGEREVASVPLQVRSAGPPAGPMIPAGTMVS
jgi:hypothetical protein